MRLDTDGGKGLKRPDSEHLRVLFWTMRNQMEKESIALESLVLEKLDYLFVIWGCQRGILTERKRSIYPINCRYISWIDVFWCAIVAVVLFRCNDVIHSVWFATAELISSPLLYSLSSKWLSLKSWMRLTSLQPLHLAQVKNLDGEQSC